jgi:hypothetical protein
VNCGLETDPALRLFLELIMRLEYLLRNMFRQMRNEMLVSKEKIGVAVKCLPVCPEPSRGIWL